MRRIMWCVQDNPPIRRKELARLLLQTSAKEELRCQGLNFEGSDLSKVGWGGEVGVLGSTDPLPSQLNLSHVNFRMANLRNCNLTHCNLQFCK